MKRGNTALKRAVSVASVAAMAIAGAVLAAPAASATVTTDVGVRATPAVDALYLSDPYKPTATYGTDTNGTGAVPVVGVGNGQAVSDVQVTLGNANLNATGGTALDDDDLFANGESFDVTVTAPAGVTFSSRPTASISGLVDLTVLNAYAGHKGTNAHEAPAVATVDTTDKAPSVSAGSPSGSSPASKFAVTFTNGSQSATTSATGTTSAGYIVSLSGLRVSVASDAAAGPIVVKAGTAETVVGYVAPFTVSVSGSTTGYPANTKGSVTLPDITVTETSKNAFVDTYTYGLEITGTDLDKDAGKVFTAGGPTTVTPSSKIQLDGTTEAGKDGTTGKITSGANGTSDLQSLTFKGATISNYKPGSDVKIGLTVANASGDNIFVDANFDGASPLTATNEATSVQAVTVGEDTAPNRTAGNSRYDTAKKIAAEYGSANAVVLANGLDAKLGIDALAANYLAGAKSAPILLTDSSGNLPQATKDAIAQVVKAKTGTVTVYVLGKTDSVSDAAADQAKFVATAAADKDATVKVVRLAGDNRYETAAAALKEAGSSSLLAYNLGSGSYYTAFLASGEVNADALAAGALSAGSGIPVLLTNGTSLNDDEAAQVKDLNIQQLIVLGSTDRVSDALIDTLKADNGIKNVVRVAGTGSTGRYDTAAALNELAITAVADKGLGVDIQGTAYLANGTDGFADALTVGPLAGKNTNPVLTVPQDSLPTNTKKFLTDHKSLLTGVSALGQSDRISDAVITEAQKAIL